MSYQVTTAMQVGFASNVQQLVQQRMSRLRPAVKVEIIKEEFHYFDQLGPSVAVKRIARHSDTPYTEIPHSRRQVALEDWEHNDFVDAQDKYRLGTLGDLSSPYAENAAMALGRVIDQTIVAAMVGTAKTGKTGATSTVFDTTNQVVATGAAGLTVAKLRSARQILIQNENDPSDEFFIVCRAKDVNTLLGTTEVTSSDYNTVKTLVSGEIDTFLGFKFLHLEAYSAATGQGALLTDTGGGSDIGVLAWRKSGVVLALGQDIRTRIVERADKSFSTQIYSSMGIGATRMEEKAVVEIRVQA